MLVRALNVPRIYFTIYDKQINIFKHSHKYILFRKEKVWIKKGIKSIFDVAMNSFNGTKICELVGIYLLSVLSNIMEKNDTSLYRDDECYRLDAKIVEQSTS